MFIFKTLKKHGKEPREDHKIITVLDNIAKEKQMSRTNMEKQRLGRDGNCI